MNVTFIVPCESPARNIFDRKDNYMVLKPTYQKYKTRIGQVQFANSKMHFLLDTALVATVAQIQEFC